MKRIVVTGGKGTIGQVLISGLGQHYEITTADLPEVDARDQASLVRVFSGNDAIVHLAWDTKRENAANEEIAPDNEIMTYNAYRAALKARVPRVITASSIHADSFSEWRGPGLMSPSQLPAPDSPYGASKIFMEALGRYYSKRGLEVVCIRFGGVWKKNEPLPPSAEAFLKAEWLSHRDCVELMRTCIEAEKIPQNYLIIYGVSNNANRVHDWVNPIGWTPRDNAASASP